MTGAPTGTTWTVQRVVTITDGDTVRLIRSRPIELDGRHYQLIDADPKGIAVRLTWINTPEKGDHPGWETARADLAHWIATQQGQITATCYESAGWDRILGDLHGRDGTSASQWMLTQANNGAGWPAYVEGT